MPPSGSHICTHTCSQANGEVYMHTHTEKQTSVGQVCAGHRGGWGGVGAKLAGRGKESKVMGDQHV